MHVSVELFGDSKDDDHSEILCALRSCSIGAAMNDDKDKIDN